MSEHTGESSGTRMGFQLLLSLIFLMSSPCIELISAADSLEAGKSISVNQTLVSSGGIFALGFFSPGNSAGRFYTGIWYNSIPNRAVVWVANREKPLLDPSGILTISRDGNLAVVDAVGSILWSSNVSGMGSNTTAVLRDDGNLVLRGEGGNMWQSFDHPTDTLLPGMKLVSSFHSKVFNRVTAWRDAEDPSPGKFSMGFDPKLFLQVIVWRGSEIYLRTQVWNGDRLFARRVANTAPTFVTTYEGGGEWMNLTFSATENSTAIRYVLDSTGRGNFMFWNDVVKDWTVAASLPGGRPCEFYNSCGPYAVCNNTSPSLMCGCLRGYKPKDQVEWDKGNFSKGCVRQAPFICDGGDSFLRGSGFKLPDNFSIMRNISALEQCEAECLRGCNCTGYAFDLVGNRGSGSWCLLWVGELMDLVQPGDHGQDLYIRHAASQQATDSSSDKNSSNKDVSGLVLILPPPLAFVMFLTAICYLWKRRTQGRERRKTGNGVPLGGMNVSSALQTGNGTIDLQILDFSSVIAATDNFSAVNKLGEGGFGPVYKGRLPHGQDVAVKRLSKVSGQGFEEFKNEVELIARLQHTNLVKLVAWCIHDEEKVLIYEYLSNKSLDKFIFDPTRSIELDWHKRIRIIEGIAQGLLYLHRYSRLRVVHRDLKTSNILLDDAMNPKISDFGLARKFRGNQTEANTNKVAGTIGYMSPEYALNGLFSEKSDVFSFGVIVLEMISGRRSTGFYLYDESSTLLGYAWRVWQEGMGLELVDSSIRRTACESEALRLIQLGLLCIQEDPADRPMMPSIISILDNKHAAIPSPKYPAFYVKRDPNLMAASSSSSRLSKSINEITLSVVEGR